MGNSVSTDISQTLNIKARRRDTFSLSINVTDANGNNFDFTTHTASMNVMDAPGGTTILSFATGGSGITLTDGNIALLKSAAAMNIAADEYVYDLQVTYPDASVKTWFKGSFTVNDDVTA